MRAVVVNKVSELQQTERNRELTGSTLQLPLGPSPSLFARSFFDRPRRSLALAMVHPTLPPELVSDIMKLPWKEERYGRRDKVTLSASCLVSKSFLPLARAELHRSLTLSISNPRHQDKVQDYTEKTLRQFLDHASYRLRETLIYYRPKFVLHVEEAHITLNSVAHPSADGSTPRAGMSFVRVAPTSTPIVSSEEGESH